MVDVVVLVEVEGVVVLEVVVEVVVVIVVDVVVVEVVDVVVVVTAGLKKTLRITENRVNDRMKTIPRKINNLVIWAFMVLPFQNFTHRIDLPRIYPVCRYRLAVLCK